MPNPPGTIRTSNDCGVTVAKVAVGTKLCPKVGLAFLTSEWRTCVETGSRVLAMISKVMLCERERVLSASRGPKRSRAWKPGNRMQP